MMIHLVTAMAITKIWSLLKQNKDYLMKLRIIFLNIIIKIEVTLVSKIGEKLILIVIVW